MLIVPWCSTVASEVGNINLDHLPITALEAASSNFCFPELRAFEKLALSPESELVANSSLLKTAVRTAVV